MKKSLLLMLTTCASLIDVSMSFAGINPITVSYLSGTTVFSTDGNGTANYVVTVNSNVMPPNAPLTFHLTSTGSSSTAFTASQITSGASPCSGISTLCNSTFSLSAGQRCCLAFTLSSRSVGSYSLQPTINTTPPAYPAQAPMDKNSAVSVIPPAIETAVGVNNDQDAPLPLLAQTVDGGISWAVLNIKNAPSGGQFFNTHCTGSGDLAYCLAVGGTPDGEPLFTVAPFIAQKSRNESSWALTNIENAPELGNLYGASCNSDAHICAAVGDAIHYTGSSISLSPPLIAQTLDYGQHWAIKPISGNHVPANASFISTSCVDKTNNNTLCAAVGQIASAPGDLNSTLNQPMLAQTTDSGSSWSIVNVPGAPTYGYFYHVSCSRYNNQALCATVGAKYKQTTPVTFDPILAQSVHSGTDWSMVSINVLGNAYLNDIHCLGGLCVAVGAHIVENAGTTSYVPLLFQTSNGGQSWSSITIEGALSITNANLYDVNCTGSDAHAICTAVGVNYDTEKPLLVQTSNGGRTWSVVSIPNIPLGNFNTTSCTGELSSAICTAVGEDDSAGLSNPAPLIAQTRDGGTTWSVVNSHMITDLPTNGIFYWNGSSGG